jgi:predicted AAA+ superfamily ATPase
MDILESFFSEKVQNRIFFPRKQSLPPDGSFWLYGARGTGKTALVIDYLSVRDADTWLYIDCQDPTFVLEDLRVEELEHFADEEGIETIVLDHYYDGFMEPLPRVKACIVVSREPPRFGLQAIELYGLDYEEFLAFGSDVSATRTFNRFLKVGTLPAIAREERATFLPVMRTFFWSGFSEDEGRLMLVLSRFQGRRVTAHRLYTYARESFRISKDWLYRTLKRFEEEKLLFWIDDPITRGGRKMFLYDYALSAYLHRGQSFGITFESMMVLSLIKHGVAFVALGQHGYRIGEHHLIIAAPFVAEESAWHSAYERLRTYRQLAIERVTFVTVSNRYRFELGGIVFEGILFYEWSVVQNE